MSNYRLPDSHADEGEKPFWISYSDLMTALMILFLVVMVASLTSLSQQTLQIQADAKLPSEVRNPVPPIDPIKDEAKEMQLQRLTQIKDVCSSIEKSAENQATSARVNCHFNRIDFGDAGRFDTGEYKLNEKGRQTLRELIPIILKVADSPTGQKWLKRIHIQGFTDTDGSYLYNLNLSLKRSEWVMCQILSTEPGNDMGLTAEQRQRAKQLFLAGGVSFNNNRSSKEASRRVELKLEFYDLAESNPDDTAPDLSLFQGNQNERCQI